MTGEPSDEHHPKLLVTREALRALGVLTTGTFHVSLEGWRSPVVIVLLGEPSVRVTSNVRSSLPPKSAAKRGALNSTVTRERANEESHLQATGPS